MTSNKELSMSKFSLEVLERCVFPFAKAEDPDVLLGAAFGEDVALTRIGGDMLVSHVDPIVGAVGNTGWLNEKIVKEALRVYNS
jgi:hydrogenase expression/formation protein HypE